MALALGALSACGTTAGQNPFTVGPTIAQDQAAVEPLNPNETVTNNFLFNTARGLTMNSVTFDQANDQLVINNLPFDGPDGIYDNSNNPIVGLDVYESRVTTTTGQRKYYGVFINLDDLQATAVGTRSYADFGFGGANIVRTSTSFDLPAGGEYIYRGTYSAVRTFDDQGGLEIVIGDADLDVDILDLDRVDDQFGAVEGIIFNRQIVDATSGATGELLPTIVLATASINDGGEVLSSNATTFLNGNVRDSGNYEGLFGGATGEELTGFLDLEGPRFQQTINIQTAILTDGTELSALNADNFAAVQSLVNQGFNPESNDGGSDPNLLEIAGLGALSVASTGVTQQDFTSEGNAREIGVFGTDQVIP